VSAVVPLLPHRLARDPSLGAEVRQAAIHASVPLFLTLLAWLGTRGTLGNAEPPPGWVLPVLALFSAGFVWSLVLKLVRALRGRIPVVEVDAQPWRPGETAAVRIVDADPGGLDGLEVALVAMGLKVERVPLTTASSSGWRFSSELRHHLPLLTLSRDELAAGPVDRRVEAVVPREAADNDWRWRIVVLGRKGKVRVPVRQDEYSVLIDTGRAPAAPMLRPD
jgi:hypothetical protein